MAETRRMGGSADRRRSQNRMEHSSAGSPIDPERHALMGASTHQLQIVGCTREVSLSVTCDGTSARLVSSPPVAYKTREGLPIYVAGLDTNVSLTVSTPLSPTGLEIRKRTLAPGQTKYGPVPVEVRW